MVASIFVLLLLLLPVPQLVRGEEGEFIGQIARWAVKFHKDFDDADFDPEEFEPPSNEDYATSEPKYCLVMTATITVEITHNNSQHIIKMPATASHDGSCESEYNEKETLRLWWPSNGTVNSLSISIARNGRVAYFSEMSATVNLPNTSLVMASNLSYHGFMAPEWPLRYRLTCNDRIKFPLYTTDQLEAITQGTISSENDQPTAILHIHEELELEAFRTDTEYPGPYGPYHSRTDFVCQFIQIYPAAPYVTALALAALVLFDLVIYYFRKRLGFKTHEREKVTLNNNK